MVGEKVVVAAIRDSILDGRRRGPARAACAVTRCSSLASTLSGIETTTFSDRQREK